MITKFKIFEGIMSEFPGMFEPRKEEDMPQVVPGFEDGTIDPEDTEPWEFDGKTYEAESERYKKFLKITKERNFKEDEHFIRINVRKLYQDYYMSIYNSKKHFKEFLDKQLLGKYIVNSIMDYDDEKIYDGTVKYIRYMFDDDSAFLEIKLKELEVPNLTFNNEIITIDKLKSKANQYNL